ncbi:MAG TPA: betaine/proline/choline family ABC transporter ATP-binding protein [Candidatus Avacidaminococcus intestinavium]|uniref:Quaternary amine transport ATP-binding protein n=1 Tax=Candidatus Avacidaminococcus intestinavium TaxID=2840684 RepID=A0A9D1SL39_9FIRM|nr:betaine/proline/choline family ABC transporter ATP-binding protein [Candidatus Avacidaminococcus intestinavium]
MSETILKVENLSKLFKTGELPGKEEQAFKMLAEGTSVEKIKAETGLFPAVSNVSFEVKKGEIFALIGLSGSGKSTIIRCLNMLHTPTKGHIYIHGEDITKYNEKQLLELRRKKIAMVFQNFGLMSHRDVLSNVCYGLEIRGVNKAEREAKGMEMIKMVGLSGWENKKIDSLSGGMKQRVGIARALANDPDILLMDEAFSALDPLVRNDLQFELLRIQEKMGKTIVFITHDINEAFKLGTRVGILREGKMVQVATPEQMLSEPADDYVRKFIDNVDPSKVFSVSNIMVIPSSVIKATDGVHLALKSMRINDVSSAFIVGEHMRFIGIITLDDALAVRAGKKTFEEAITTDLQIIRDMDTPVADVVELAAEAKFPLVVVSEGDVFCGIVSKAAILSSFVN